MVGTWECSSVVLKLYVFVLKKIGTGNTLSKTPNVAGFDRIETGQLLPISDPVETRNITGLFVWLW